MTKPLATILAIIAACTALCAPVWLRSGADEKVPAWIEPPGVRQESDSVSECRITAQRYDHELLLTPMRLEDFESTASDEVSPKEESSPVVEAPPGSDKIETVNALTGPPLEPEKPLNEMPASVPDSTPARETTIDGKPFVWVQGFGYIESGGSGEITYAEDMYESGVKIGIMGSEGVSPPRANATPSAELPEQIGEVIDQTINETPQKNSMPPDYRPETIPRAE
ncbi:MAG: hypothetical protein ACOX7I_00770 [Oscillospiraceae bacterium]|jgi:hypothetical protein